MCLHNFLGNGLLVVADVQGTIKALAMEPRYQLITGMRFAVTFVSTGLITRRQHVF